MKRWALCLIATSAIATPRIDGRARWMMLGAMRPEPVSVRIAGGAATLIAHGFAARPGAGDVAFVDGDQAALAAIAALPGVRAIEPVAALHPSLDQSRPLTGWVAARNETGLDGQGVLVAVVDTGCDFRHADFRTREGKTRIAALLDLGHPATAAHPELDYGGAVSLREEIDAQLEADAATQTAAAPVLERDIDGHGSHVLGIAAGSGWATSNGLLALRYQGMAPAATLVMARATRDGHHFTEEDVLTGLRFAVDRAQALAQPLVVDLSLSGDGGPHDGTSNFEQAIDALFPADLPGRAIVIATGNSGARSLHAGGYELSGPLALPLHVAGATQVSIDLWFSEAPISLTVVAPSGKLSGPVASGSKLLENGVALDDASGGVDPLNGRFSAHIDLGSAPPAGTWQILLTGRSHRWDAWATAAPIGSARFGAQLDDSDTAEPPAFARSAITVGSFVSRDRWTSPLGTLITRNLVVGSLSKFSAAGPTADGRFLPDLVAPGEFIAAPLSSDAPPDQSGSAFFVAGDPNYLRADDGLHGLLRGTSQAAPHVAGAIALLLQRDPTLTREQLRELLRASAIPPPGEPGYTARGGFGHLDVGRGLRLLDRIPTDPLDPKTSTVDVSRSLVPPGNDLVRVSVTPRDATGRPIGPGHEVHIEAADLSLPYAAIFQGPVADRGEGRYERVLMAAGPRRAALRIHAAVDGVELEPHPTVWLVAQASELSSPRGCMLGASHHAPWPLGALLLCITLFGRYTARAHGVSRHFTRSPPHDRLQPPGGR